MVKTHTSLTIDQELLEQAKSLRINISSSCNEYLRSLVDNYNENIEGINIKLEKINLEKAINKITKYRLLAKQYEIKINKWEEIQKKKEETKLKEEKDTIENAKKCVGCNHIIEDGYKIHNFTKGIVCNNCFMNATPDNYKKWQTK